MMASLALILIALGAGVFLFMRLGHRAGAFRRAQSFLGGAVWLIAGSMAIMVGWVIVGVFMVTLGCYFALSAANDSGIRTEGAPNPKNLIR